MNKMPFTSKKPANKLQWRKQFCMVFLYVMLFAGCTATMLDYNFEGYDEGDAVGGDEPGPNSIGLIKVEQGHPSLYGVSTLNALYGQKSLRLEKGTPPNCTGDFCLPDFIILFSPNPPPNEDRPVLFSWEGRLSNAQSTTSLQAIISLPGPVFDRELSLNIFRDHIEIRNGSSPVEAFQYDFNNKHRLMLRISPQEGTYAVQIAGAGIDNPPSNNPACESQSVFCGTYPIDDSNNNKPLDLLMQFSQNSNLGAVYQVDNVKNTQPQF
jgi:hypothetical protein